MGHQGNNKRFVIDMGWYLLGTMIPMGVGFIKTPIFTRYFTPEEYGYLGLITITFSYISIFLYSWLSSCLWRYYNAYKHKNDLTGLYSNMFFLFLSASVIMLLISGIWSVIADKTLVKQLILLSFAQFVFKEFISLYLITIRLEGKALRYNLVHSFRAILSFVVLYVMTFVMHYRITSVLISAIVVDAAVLLIVVFLGNEKIRITWRKVSKETLHLLLKFGSIGLVSNFFFLLITSSDRYIIALYNDMSTVGIYNQVYNICQLSVVALVTVYFNTINPKLNKELELNFEKANALMANYIFVFFMFGFPLVTYLSMFPKQIAMILLGEEFRSGYSLMPFIFISAYLYGLFLFIEVKFKFADKLRNIAIGVILASVLNIILNFTLIPLYGYQWAAISTLISYGVIILYFFGQDSLGFFKNNLFARYTMAFIVVLAIEVIFDYYLRKYYSLNLWQTILEVILFGLNYFGIFYKQIKKLKIPV